MENKPQNVFDKLDKQGEQIEDISKKLEGVSVNDSYALAKRTWDCGDFQTAQKYYNHISLLKPLDWEAPLYASLCNFKGYHNLCFWVDVPKQLEKICISTIKYIYSLDLDEEKKNKEMEKCLEIIKDEIISLKEMYFDYKDEFDNEWSNYIYSLQNLIFNIYLTLKNIKLNQVHIFIIDFSNILLELINKTNKISSKISKENFNDLIGISNLNFKMDYDVIFKKCKVEISNSVDNLSYEEIKEIKLKGTMYFEYNDKVIPKKIFLKNLIYGILLIVFSITGIVYCSLGNLFFYLAFIFPLLYGLVLTFKAFLFKNKIKCSSYLNVRRIKNRLSSNGNIVNENKFNPLKIVSYTVMYIQTVISFYLFVAIIVQLIENKFNEKFYLIIAIFLIIYTVLCFISTLINSNNPYMGTTNGKFSYKYKHKIYQF